MHKLGDKVRCIDQAGLFEIIASKDNPQETAVGTLPPVGFDYTLKRIDGHMSSDFELYKHTLESLIEKE